ncbi:MAG: hypothetical protein Q7J15_09110 [Candidatus Desulfaltia sp.]|nr:hypothetical protein [Candidatus Desulfaltia sp.]
MKTKKSMTQAEKALEEERILSGATAETKEKAFKTFPLRIPLDLHKAAKETAWRNRESLHEFILNSICKNLYDNMQKM